MGRRVARFQYDRCRQRIDRRPRDGVVESADTPPGTVSAIPPDPHRDSHHARGDGEARSAPPRGARWVRRGAVRRSRKPRPTGCPAVRHMAIARWEWLQPLQPSYRIARAGSRRPSFPGSASWYSIENVCPAIDETVLDFSGTEVLRSATSGGLPRWSLDDWSVSMHGEEAPNRHPVECPFPRRSAFWVRRANKLHEAAGLVP